MHSRISERGNEDATYSTVGSINISYLKIPATLRFALK